MMRFGLSLEGPATWNRGFGIDTISYNNFDVNSKQNRMQLGRSCSFRILVTVLVS